MNTADLIGIFGVVCYQLAYAGMQLGFLQREDRSYLILNLFGPCCLLYSLLFHFNLAAAISQVLWLLWSCVGMAKTSLARRQVPPLGTERAPSLSTPHSPASPAVAQHVVLRPSPMREFPRQDDAEIL